MLYLVVHHHQDRSQPWINKWIDDDRVKTITTTREIGRHCEKAAQSGERIRFHRCGYGTSGPLICAEARVASVEAVDKTMYLVHFDEHIVLQVASQAIPQGTSWYRL
ncbi:hypothetical protein [Corallococcus terminator]|uniref:Uncharacterized protein n=1 Tax=Corallococcus terminator TaxID=2316733 RepID=A0A3A8J9R4_9BACT|nr:hypothetical protein [Corallococcus terminator]RKG92439.1 hypothetical protein D7V88_06005 [Corallococcus terminator]